MCTAKMAMCFLLILAQSFRLSRFSGSRPKLVIINLPLVSANMQQSSKRMKLDHAERLPYNEAQVGGRQWSGGGLGVGGGQPATAADDPPATTADAPAAGAARRPTASVGGMPAAAADDPPAADAGAPAAGATSRQRASTDPRIIEDVMSVISGNPSRLASPVCADCRSYWFCTCAYKHLDLRVMPTTHRFPVPPVSQTLGSWASIETRAGQSGDQESPQRQPARRKKPTGTADAHARMNQRNWEEIQKCLPRRTAQLPSCRQEFHEIEGDSNFQVALPTDDDYLGHAMRMVASIPGRLNYKIGITRSPSTRFYRSPFAYALNSVQARDRATWDCMVVIFAHHHRDVVAMLEHSLIHNFATKTRRCKNKRFEFDTGDRFCRNDSDSEKEDAPHTCFLYVVTGEPI